jgi:gamma-glutamyltranspeptidase/glutathione hydrolase
MVVAPHRLAAEAGAAVLREGGNAIEAMIAAAATVAVVYPHMNGLGGDNFWLVHEPGRPPVGIDACGAAAGLATPEWYAAHGHTGAIPTRGPHAALTVAGAVSGWQLARHMSHRWGGRLPLSRLFADAIARARDGFPVSGTQARTTAGKRPELEPVPGFAATYMPDGAPPAPGATFRLPALAATLDHLAHAGLDDLYQGDLARSLAADLAAAGSPLRLADLERHRALTVAPLAVRLAHGTAYGMPPPTQGLASMMILGLYDDLVRRHGITAAGGFAHVHALVEATKQAFLVRDAHVTDPAYMTVDPTLYLTPAMLAERAARIDRGTSFALDPARQNALRPHRRPFHTIQPALALFDDGRVMPYGTMGGEGQPQTQAMIYTRHVVHGQPLHAALDAPRWLLGRTWGSAHTNLRIESRLDPAVIDDLRTAGHDVEVIGPMDEIMGHAGALVLHTAGDLAGTVDGASDPRSDGAAVAA